MLQYMPFAYTQSVVSALPRQAETNALTWHTAIQLFQTIYMASRNLAARTRDEYKTDVTQLAEFLQDRGVSRIGETGLSHLQTFLAEFDGRGLTGATRRRKTAVPATSVIWRDSWRTSGMIYL